MTQKSCAAAMRNAIPRNHLKPTSKFLKKISLRVLPLFFQLSAKFPFECRPIFFQPTAKFPKKIFLVASIVLENGINWADQRTWRSVIEKTDDFRCVTLFVPIQCLLCLFQMETNIYLICDVYQMYVNVINANNY